MSSAEGPIAASSMATIPTTISTATTTSPTTSTPKPEQNSKRSRAQEIKQLQEVALAALPAQTLYIVLYIRGEPPEANDFHWALYHHHKGRGGGGTKYHVRGVGGGWFTDHGPNGNIFKEAFLCALIRIAAIPPDKEQDLQDLICADDSVVNTLPGLTCRVWELGCLKRLAEKGLIACTDVQALEQEIFAIGNEHRFTAANNDQPRPVIDSSIYRD